MNGDTLLGTLQEYCTEQGVSDIHLSPEKEEVRLEIRLHGMLQLLTRLPHTLHTDLMRRIKFASKLKLNVTNVPQDGQYTFEQGNRRVNVRVATLPTPYAEACTLRLLDPKRGLQPLEKLGFDAETQAQLEKVMQSPHGLFLVTGPTGSGKTTTLYALLQSMVGKARNIITLEDPIEYELPGITQSEIDIREGYDFSSGLRSVLRHDPDIVLVGEIRDYETAQTAIDAALTGHLVLSTLHTNSSIEAIPRLLSMGVTPYTFAPALRAVLAQRLVRTLKKDSIEKDPLDPESYDGRLCISELLMVNASIREHILLASDSAEIEKIARTHGYKSMHESGMELVKQGITSEVELRRVAM